ncbi:raptor N-terminal caspase like domain-containing protein [Entophlyctis helioformis]|nr:raptor N-terminal caspase like domain-containing protein [Entophlyctis helioformis]
MPIVRPHGHQAQAASASADAAAPSAVSTAASTAVALAAPPSDPSAPATAEAGPPAATTPQVLGWRMRERLKTVSVALVVCLNIGVDPPDVIKPNPCARMECWIDPAALPPQRSLEAIGRNLQQQYEVWQPRARHRLFLDPSIEEIKKMCCSLRRNAKDERILFHYNGHGVPKPTPGGEIWVFNKNYTQYIPVSIYDIQTWLGSPCIFVYDCSNAGNILVAERRDGLGGAGPGSASGVPGATYIPLRECIQLAACQPNELLPTSPDLPADLFTCCLTTPIEIALRWFVLQSDLSHKVTPNMIMKIPGKLGDRRTPLGELNWIFTAITDTIAWNVLPSAMFQKLFRQDLMVAALFRNFFLADRIMRYYHRSNAAHAQKVEYKFSSFFTEQLTAFEVWLRKGPISRKPPQQLPIVHRLRALMLLSKFLDLGQWAVNLGLSVGIFPPASELKPTLVFIWAKILAVDPSCQNDLVKDNGYTYFINILSADHNNMPPMSNPSEHRAMCAFILSVFCHDFRFGQQACLKTDLLQALLPHLEDKDPLLRQWACVCLTELCKGYPEAKWLALSRNVHEYLAIMLADPVAEVRAAALAALGTLFGHLEKTPQQTAIEQKMVMLMLKAHTDASPLVRQELVVALSRFVGEYTSRFCTVALELMDSERRRAGSVADGRRGQGGLDRVPSSSASSLSSQGSLHTTVWKTLLCLSVDPAKNVAALASLVVDKVHFCMLTTPPTDSAAMLTVSMMPLGAGTIGAGDGPAGMLSGSGGGGLAGAAGVTALTLGSSGSGGGGGGSSLLGGSGASLPPPALLGPLQPPAIGTTGFYALDGSKVAGGYIGTARGTAAGGSASAASAGSGGGSAGGGNGSGPGIGGSDLLGARRLDPNRHRPASMAGNVSGLSGLGPGGAASGAAGSRGGGGAGDGQGQTIRRSPAGLMVGSYGAQHTQGGRSGVLGASGGNNQTPASPALGSGGRRPPGAVPGRLQRPMSVPSFARHIEDGQFLSDAAVAGQQQAQQGQQGQPTRQAPMDAAALALTRADAEKIGIESSFYAWSCEYFGEPQMRVPDIDDPGSLKHIERQWRKDRNRKIVADTEALYPYAPTSRFDEFVGSIGHERPAHLVQFHTFEPMLVTADDQTVMIYNWETQTKINSFSNDNSRGSRLTSMQIINEDDTSLLLTGSDDGLVRLYRSFDQPGSVELVSAWRAISDIMPGSRAGLVSKWQQGNGYLFTGGDSSVVKVWDAAEELCVQEIPTKSVSQVSDLAVDPSGSMVLAGFVDGSVKLYDRRLPPNETLIANFAESAGRVLQVSYVGYQSQEFLMGTTTGDVLLWDIRQRARTLRINTGIVDEMSGFGIHDQGLLVACGSNTQNVRVLNLMGEAIGNVRYNEGFLQRQTVPVVSLAFHPRQLFLAVNTASTVSIFCSEIRNPPIALV